MAVRTERIDHWSCDLCGAEHEPAGLRHVRGDDVPGAGGARLARPAVQVDVCEACQDKPIRDLLAAIAATEEDPAFRPVTVRRVTG
jgi:hypothetical protein